MWSGPQRSSCLQGGTAIAIALGICNTECTVKLNPFHDLFFLLPQYLIQKDHHHDEHKVYRATAESLDDQEINVARGENSMNESSLNNSSLTGLGICNKTNQQQLTSSRCNSSLPTGLHRVFRPQDGRKAGGMTWVSPVLKPTKVRCAILKETR